MRGSDRLSEPALTPQIIIPDCDMSAVWSQDTSDRPLYNFLWRLSILQKQIFTEYQEEDL